MPDHPAYDFSAPENEEKWKKLFMSSLEKVLREVHQSLNIREDALDYVATLIVRMLAVLCASNPHTIADLEERVRKKMPKPIEQWALRDAQAAIEKSAKNKKTQHVALPVDKVHNTLVKDVLQYKIDHQVSVYITAVLEYVAADILKLAGNYVKNIRHTEITMQDIRVAMCADKVLMEMFFSEEDDEYTLSMDSGNNGTDTGAGSKLYSELVKDLLLEENQYLRDLNMIIHVFRAEFVQLFPRSKDIEAIFSNILDIHTLTQSIISEIDDAIEATEENETPYIGSCFDDIFEAEEFFCYERYVDEIKKGQGRMRLNALLLNDQVISAFKALNSGIGCLDAAKYVLPGLLVSPVFHFLHFCDTLKVFQEMTDNEEDKVCLMQLIDQLSPIKSLCDKSLSSKYILSRNNSSVSGTAVGRSNIRGHITPTLRTVDEIQRLIEGWVGRDIVQSCSHLLAEGSLQMVGRRLTDRHVFLFDNLIVLTKQNTRRASVGAGVAAEYKLKEKHPIRKIDVIDNPDTEELKNTFTLQVKDTQSIVLSAKTVEDKYMWMSHLVHLSTWSMLERLLDSKMKEAEKQQPLRLPPTDEYIFSEPDSTDNIIFEDKQESKECPLIKGGTLPKLVERLTYHTYADPKFVRTFLTTFRTFCTPDEFLDLLIRRYNIPEASINDEEADPNSELTNQAREERKRFRNEYVKPVQFRVLNVVRHWVDHHWYDFDQSALRVKLQSFLESVKGRAMRKWVETIGKIIHRKSSSGEKGPKNISYRTKHPPTEWHLTKDSKEFDLMTLHPIEIARQITLREFELYQSIMPSELVGTVWMKDKYRSSKNLLTTIKQSTKFTFWLEKCIVEAENLEERVMVVSRIIEIMLVLEELNNFTGILEVVSALNSASIHRLNHTFDEVDKKLMRGFNRLKSLSENHHRRLMDRLRSIDPPCVPFLGIYLTNILYTEEGNPDFLLNRTTEMINFSKRRKVAEITAEIQQYQNQPYCLTVVPSIREYLDAIDPLSNMTEKEFEDYLYHKSLEIEPRKPKPLPKFEKKREYILKSPGIKPMNARHAGLIPSSHKEKFNLYSGSIHSSMASMSNMSITSFTSTVMSEADQSNSDADLSSSPTTPNTPMTPPHGSNKNRCSDFPCVTDGDTASVMTRHSSSSTLQADDTSSLYSFNSITQYDSALSSTTLSSATLNEPDTPPVVPPRMRNSTLSSWRGSHDQDASSPSYLANTSFYSSGSVFSEVEDDRVADLPPRIPPRLPPRTLNTHHQYGAVGLVPPPSPPGVNEMVPEVPPRTYKHFRQSSS